MLRLTKSFSILVGSQPAFVVTLPARPSLSYIHDFISKGQKRRIKHDVHWADLKHDDAEVDR